MTYQFDVELATKHGIEKAVLLHHLLFWQYRNEANGKNLKDGKTWTYNTGAAFAKLFPFWSTHKIYRLLRELEQEGLIESRCYSDKKSDRTKWYTVTNLQNCKMDFAELQNGCCKTANSLKTDIKPDRNQIEDSDFEGLWEKYQRRGNKKTARKQWNRLSDEQKHEVLSRVSVYVESTPELMYRKRLETWLNPKVEYWKDITPREYAITKRRQREQEANKKTAEAAIRGETERLAGLLSWGEKKACEADSYKQILLSKYGARANRIIENAVEMAASISAGGTDSVS
jgi:predicted transcriptional regulator